MKGMSFKDKQSGIKGYKRGDMNSPILQVKDYFKTSLFVDDKPYVAPQEKMYSDAGDQYLGEDYKTIEDAKKKEKEVKETKEQPQKQQATSTLDPELLLAATMPIGYMIGKGLTALMNRKSRKKQQAEELAAAEKKGIEKGKKTVYSHEDYLRDKAKRIEENPTVDKPTKGKKEIKVKTKKNPY